MNDKPARSLLSKLWEVALLLIVLSFSAQLVMTNVVPLPPYAAGTALVAGLVWLAVARSRRW